MRRAVEWLRRKIGRQSDWRDEIESHLEMRAAWLKQAGAAPMDAKDEAQRRFGNQLRILEHVRAAHIPMWFDDAMQDAFHALRGFGRSKTFTGTAVGTLAIGIGAATAVFSFVDPLLFRPLPYPAAEQLVSVGTSAPLDSNEFVVGGMYFDWKEQQTAFAEITSMTPASQCDLGVGAPERIDCISVEANFLHTLGVTPLLGRMFSADEDRPKGGKVALISYNIWQRKFEGQASVLGRVLMLDGQPFRIIGILPSNFLMPQRGKADVLTPAQIDTVRARAPNSTLFLRAFARLKPGVSLEEARKRMTPLFRASVKTAVPKELQREVHLVIRPLRDRQIGGAKASSWLLLGSVVLLLLLTCGNVANLILARAASRTSEMAVRTALGAGSGRLLRQALTESALLSLAAGVVGSGLSWLLLRVLVGLAPGGFLELEKAHVDGRILVFTTALSVFSALVLAIAPLLQRPTLESLTGSRIAGARRMFMRQTLVAGQIALSVILLSGASLFVRSLIHLQRQTGGFRSENLYSASFVLSRQRYPGVDRQEATFDAIENKLQQTPWFASVALSDSMPPAGGMHGRPYSNLRISGHRAVEPNGGMVAFRYVTPGYFKTLGVHLIAGRVFADEERASDETSIILSRSLAKKLFGQDNPIGTRISLDAGSTWVNVIGVVEDVKNNGLNADAWPEYYRLRVRHSHQLGLNGVALIRTTLKMDRLSSWVRREFAAIDPTLPIKLELMEQRVRSLNDAPRFLASILSAFGVIGVLLAMVGLYGVTSFLVSQRTREIGVRSALGATPFSIALLVQKHAGLAMVGGLLVGVPSALGLNYLLRALLFETSPADPVAISTAVLILIGTGFFAAWSPARRAARVDPLIALREN